MAISVTEVLHGTILTMADSYRIAADSTTFSIRYCLALLSWHCGSFSCLWCYWSRTNISGHHRQSLFAGPYALGGGGEEDSFYWVIFECALFLMAVYLGCHMPMSNYLHDRCRVGAFSRNGGLSFCERFSSIRVFTQNCVPR